MIGGTRMWAASRLIWIGVALVLVLAPLGLPPFAMTLFTEAVILGLFAMSLDLMFGYTRLVSFGHAAAYGLLTYQTAYLKANFTPEFIAALLSSEIEDSNKRDIMVEHIDDARKLGAEVLPPDVNQGDVEFTVADAETLHALVGCQ